MNKKKKKKATERRPPYSALFPAPFLLFSFLSATFPFLILFPFLSSTSLSLFSFLFLLLLCFSFFSFSFLLLLLSFSHMFLPICLLPLSIPPILLPTTSSIGSGKEENKGKDKRKFSRRKRQSPKGNSYSICACTFNQNDKVKKKYVETCSDSTVWQPSLPKEQATIWDPKMASNSTWHTSRSMQ